MALPKLTVMKHELILPSTGEKVTYRPFLVKEEKILMMAVQSEDAKEMVRVLREIIKNCVESELDIKSLTMFDIEYVFLQLRARSVGETIPVTYSSEEENECGGNSGVLCNFESTIQIDDIKVEKSKDHNDMIELTDTIKVKMRYPEIEMSTALGGLKGKEVVNATFSMVGQCIEYIMDNEDIHKTSDHTEAEVDEFLNSLSAAQFKDIQKFFDTMPKLRHELISKCTKCDKENKKILEGMADFFV